MMRPSATRPFLPALALTVLATLAIAGCSEKAQPPPPPVVRKVVPKEAAKAAEAPPAADNAAKTTAEERYNPKGKRDPFEPYLKPERKISQADLTAIPPLQRYDIGELKFVGVIWTARGAHALVEDTGGKGYTVRVGTKIGRGGGVVTRITDGELFIGEESRGATGARVVREFSLKLHTAGGK